VFGTCVEEQSNAAPAPLVTLVTRQLLMKEVGLLQTFIVNVLPHFLFCLREGARGYRHQRMHEFGGERSAGGLMSFLRRSFSVAVKSSIESEEYK